jgi:hypothetical protein
LDYPALFDALAALQTGAHPVYFDMQRELVKTSTSQGKAYEAYIEKFLRLCFGSCFDKLNVKAQSATRRRITIRDFVISNTNSSHAFLKRLEHKGSEFLLFDAKNYDKPLASRDLAVFQQYLSANAAFGRFGIILSRKGASSNCEESVFRAVINERIVMLVLVEDDLLKMLDRARQGRSPVDVIAEKYEALVLQS